MKDLKIHLVYVLGLLVLPFCVVYDLLHYSAQATKQVFSFTWLNCRSFYFSHNRAYKELLKSLDKE